MRVLFVNDTSRNGGPGRSLYTILKHLPPERVHRSVLLPHRGILADWYEETKIADDLFVLPDLVENPIEPWSRPMERKDYDAPLPLRVLRLLGNLGRGARGVFELARLAREGRYDLLYCNGTNANFFGAIAAQLSGVPALWHVRYTSLPAPLLPVHNLLAESEQVAAIVCVSGAAAALLPARAQHKLRVVHNAVDLEEFDAAQPCLREELGLTAEHVVFGSQGRILPRKGYLELIEAVRLALPRLRAPLRERVRFVILGDTPEDLRPDHLAECRAKVEAYQLGAHVHFLGFRADVRSYVAEYDVGVVPSIYPDPLPRAVIECMALGKPVLAFDVGGVGEMLAGGEVGQLLGGNPADVAGLATAIVRYAEDAELRQRQGRAARLRIETEYEARAHAARILSIMTQASRAG